MSAFYICLFSAFCFSFVFDFKGREGGSLVQMAMAGLALTATAGVVLFVPRSGSITRRMTPFVIFFSFVVFAVLVAALRDVPADRWTRMALPYVLFACGLLVGQRYRSGPVRAEILLSIIRWGLLLSVIWRPIHALLFLGIPISEMRYQILGPGIPLLAAWLAASFLARGRLTIFWFLSLSVLTAVIAISLTRSYLYTMLAIPVVALLMYFQVLRRGAAVRDLPSLLRGMIVFPTIAISAGGVIAFAFRPDVGKLWIERILYQRAESSGRDITLVTRIAEAEGIWESVSQSFDRLIAGCGLGETYMWSAKYQAELGAAATNFEFATGFWYASHSEWTYLLFATGLIGLIVVLGWFLLRAFELYARVLDQASERRQLDGVALWAFLGLVAFFNQSPFMAPLHERLTPCMLGVLLGFAIDHPSFASRARPPVIPKVARGSIAK